MALKYNPQSSEVSKKIKKLELLNKNKKRAQEVEDLKSNVDMAKHLDAVKSELVSSLLHFKQYLWDAWTLLEEDSFPEN